MRNVIKSARLVAISLVAMVAAVGSWPAAAQLEEIIVTARKREQSVQDIGITISAFNENAIRDLGAGRDQQALLGQVANAQSYLTGTFLQSAHIRGIGLNEFQGQYDSPVAQNVDEVYMSKPWMISRPKFDLERIEVLKGPQGTLFGRNTTAGALNFYTNAPTKSLEAYLDASYDIHERALIEGAVSGSITGDLLGRFSFLTNFGSGGPQFNLFTGKEHGEPDLYEIRGQLAWSNDSTRIRTLFHTGQDKSEKVAWKGPGIFNVGGGYCPELLAGAVTDAPATCAKFAGLTGDPELEFEPTGTYTINANTPAASDDEFGGGYLRVDHDTGWGTITSISSYEYYDRDIQEDSDSSPLRSVDTRYWNQIDSISQELRLTGTLTESWRYVLGFFYQHDDLDQVDGSYLGGNPLGIVPPFAPHFFEESQYDVDSVAGFFQAEHDVTDRLRIIAGARYTRDDIKAQGIAGLGLDDPVGAADRVTPCIITTFTPAGQSSPACAFLDPFLGRAPNDGVFKDDRTDSNVSWRAELEYDIRDRMMLYASLATGYRSGGYSIPFAGTVTQFTPEELFVQEAGIKSTLLDGTLQANMAVFHYQYDDVQVNVDDPISPVVPITRNVGKQENIGFEADLWWKPTDNWDAKFGVGYLDAEYDEVNISPSTGLPFSITSYGIVAPLKGNRPVNSPKWNLNGLLRYQHRLFEGWDLILMSDVRWTDERFLEASNLPFDRADAYTVVNARAGLQSQDGTWEMSIWGRNILDERYLTYINNIAFFKLDIFGEKPTFGLDIRYKFN